MKNKINIYLKAHDLQEMLILCSVITTSGFFCSLLLFGKLYCYITYKRNIINIEVGGLSEKEHILITT